MDRDRTAVTAFLAFIFLLSFFSHLLYVKGYAFALGAQHLELETRLSDKPFADQIECELTTNAYCEYFKCDAAEEGSAAAEQCGHNRKSGWYPTAE